MFETSFDADPSAEELLKEMEEASEEQEEQSVEEEIIVPTFSEEEVNAAREQGFSAGREEGLKNAEESIGKRTMELIGIFDTHIARLFKDQEVANEETVRTAISVAYSITKKLFPRQEKEQGLPEIEAMVADVMGRIIDKPSLTIRVNSELAEPLRTAMGGMPESGAYDGKINLIADGEMPVGDVRINWSNGGMERNSSQLWQEINAVIEQNINAAPMLPEVSEPEDDSLPENDEESVETGELASDPKITADMDVTDAAQVVDKTTDLTAEAETPTLDESGESEGLQPLPSGPDTPPETDESGTLEETADHSTDTDMPTIEENDMEIPNQDED